MSTKIESRLQELGIRLPTAMAPGANFVPCVEHGGLLLMSGQISVLHDGERYIGKVGREVPLADAKAGARLCALNLLAQAKAFLGDLDRIARVLQVQGFVNAAPDFTQHPEVINGASDLLVALWGDAGRHARFAVGAGSLPFNAAVEVAATFAVGGR
jgi:enamine deaminase RidA (YjgF/YER057c/UK114 family)